jgi:hypothetical protein
MASWTRLSQAPTCGVKHDDLLSPLLFGLFTDKFESWLRAKLPHVGVQMGQKLVQMLLYADDMVMLSYLTKLMSYNRCSRLFYMSFA